MVLPTVDFFQALGTVNKLIRLNPSVSIQYLIYQTRWVHMNNVLTLDVGWILATFAVWVGKSPSNQWIGSREQREPIVSPGFPFRQWVKPWALRPLASPRQSTSNLSYMYNYYINIVYFSVCKSVYIYIYIYIYIYVYSTITCNSNHIHTF